MPLDGQTRCSFRGKDAGSVDRSSHRRDCVTRAEPVASSVAGPHRLYFAKPFYKSRAPPYNWAMDGEGRDGRLRSFVLGGLLGASAVFAAARRRRPKRSRKRRPMGLAAFEEAPCYREKEHSRRD